MQSVDIVKLVILKLIYIMSVVFIRYTVLKNRRGHIVTQHVI